MGRAAYATKAEIRPNHGLVPHFVLHVTGVCVNVLNTTA
jgi:hypothetical protein